MPARRERARELGRALDEVDEHRLGLLGQPGDRARAQHLAGVEHDHRVARPLDVAHQVRRDDDADPELAPDAADQLEHVAPPERVEPGRRLVEEREHRVVDERLRELHALLHPGRVRAHRPVALLEQADVPQQVGGAQPRGRARQAADLGHVGEELRGRRAGRQAVVLGRVADARAVLDDARVSRPSTSTEPASGVDQAHAELERGRLAGAVRAEQPGDALADLEARPVERPHRPVGLRHPGDADERHAASVSTATRARRSGPSSSRLGDQPDRRLAVERPQPADALRIGGCVMNSDEMPPRGSGLTA